MNIIEMIIYIGILVLLLSSSVFSAYSVLFSQKSFQDKVEKVDLTKGFIASTAVMMISLALLVAALASSQEVALLFDAANHKQQRILATTSALKCLNLSIVELEHDYFYRVDSTGIQHPNLHCSIQSVVSPSSADINNPGNVRMITVTGQSTIVATIVTRVLINSQNISLMSFSTIF